MVVGKNVNRGNYGIFENFSGSWITRESDI
jgi:hypothetical protein